MTNRFFSFETRYALGLLGLFLVLVLARLARPACRPPQNTADRLTGFLARRAIDCIAAIGWLIDHLPPAQHYVAPTLRRARWQDCKE